MEKDPYGRQKNMNDPENENIPYFGGDGGGGGSGGGGQPTIEGTGGGGETMTPMSG
jgi:hypothetical protein